MKKTSSNWKYTSVKDSLPPEGDGISVLAINDNMPGICCAEGKIMNSTWFNKHHKKEKWTHWMLLPERPMLSTEKLHFKEIQHKHRVKLPQDYRAYNPSILTCPNCCKENNYESLHISQKEFDLCPYKNDCVGFAKLDDGVVMVSECPKCFTRYYCHAYTKETYQDFLSGKFKVIHL